MNEEKSASEHPETKREILSREEAETFANKGSREIAPGTENNARCVDGRYENVDAAPLTYPGADAGYAMTVLRALRELYIEADMEQALEIVLQTVGGASQFRFHTDEHAQKEKALSGFGCGHLREALGSPEAYDLKKEDMDTLFQNLEKLKKEDAKEVMLKGEHAEGAVIMVESNTHGIQSKDEGEGKVKMAFIFHDTLHKKRLKRLASAIKELVPPASVLRSEQIESALEEASKKQLKETLKRLAKGLPIYVAQSNEKGAFSVKELSS